MGELNNMKKSNKLVLAKDEQKIIERLKSESIEKARKTLKTYEKYQKKEFISVPKDIMVGLFRIMCNIPYSMSGMEVYPEVIENMQTAQQWILTYGKTHNIDSRGLNEHLLTKGE